MKIKIIIEKKSGNDNIHHGKFQRENEIADFTILNSELNKLANWKFLKKMENSSSKDYYIREIEVDEL